MKNTRLFDIVTLSDNQKGFMMKNNLSDPVSIITGGIAVLQQLFPTWFGPNRRTLTNADWLQIIPGNGYWTSRYREWMKARIKFDTNLGNMTEYTRYFVDEHRHQLNTALPPYQQGEQNAITVEQFNQVFQKFLSILKQESQTGGQSPVGVIPGGSGSTYDLNSLLPIAAGGLILYAAMKKKRRTR